MAAALAIVPPTAPWTTPSSSEARPDGTGRTPSSASSPGFDPLPPEREGDKDDREKQRRERAPAQDAGHRSDPLAVEDRDRRHLQHQLLENELVGGLLGLHAPGELAQFMMGKR